ncbi:MAG: hypothetical protein BM561_02085 [Vibrio sp. MedPE-SWchi]|nr:MAG: hypothetical protein BM561_02085 [Vibrio sp. MedPE-SWchi]
MSVLNKYFDGLHQGDSAKLRSIFHADAWLKAPGVRRSLETWLKDVEEREIPASLNLPFSFKVLDLDIVKDQAMAKIYCPLFDYEYIDYLGLLKEEGQWRIVSKMYTDVRETV